jgi:hypothetical protein
MKVFKWVLIVFGAILLVLIAVGAAGYFWASNIESVKFTAADLDVGGSYPAEERQALLDACQKSSEADGADATACTCITDNAGTQLSRVERLLLAAGLEKSPTKVVAVTKGLIFGGVPQEKVDEMRAFAKRRTRELLESCGIE